MSDILSTINKAQINYILNNKKEPTFCYLGKKEMDDFLDRITEFMELEERPSHEQNMDFLGLKLILVSAASHFHIA